MRHSLRASTLACLLLAPAFGLSGCGGGQGSGATRNAATGGLRFTIDWPVRDTPGASATATAGTNASASRRTRLIPAAAQSVVMDVYSLLEVPLAHQVITRPAGQATSDATFKGLPAQELILSVQARPNADGSGVTQAQASMHVTVPAGKTAEANLTMNSSIDHVNITPGNATILVGKSQTFTATARDRDGSVVLTAPGAFRWTNGTPAFATLTLAGDMAVLLGVAPGTLSLSVTENDSQQGGTTPVAIAAPPANGSADINVH